MSASVKSSTVPSGSLNEIRVILLGKTGAGKSSFGNTIVGDKVFQTGVSARARRDRCAMGSRWFDNKQIYVVDTPGLFHTEVSETTITQEIANSYQMIAPGPHAFLLVLNAYTRFTAEDSKQLTYLEAIFGPKAIQYTIIIFTHADSFEEITIQDYLDKLKPNAPLGQLLNQCNYRYISVNNKGTQSEKDTAVKNLLNMIEELIKSNNNQVYRSDIFDADSKAVKGSTDNGTVGKRFLDGKEELDRTLPPLEGYEKKPLVALEEAVKSIDVSIYNLDAMVWTAKRHARNPSDSLTPDESASICLYSLEWPEGHDSFYKVLNEKLRAENRNCLIPWFSYLKLFLTALYKLPSTKQTIWRGIRGDVRHLYKQDFIWWGFSSCSSTNEVIKQFLGPSGVRTIFMIESINGKALSSHSSYQSENEILLMPGTYLRVKGKSKLGNDLYMIHLQEEDPPHKLRKSPFNLASVASVSVLQDKPWLDLQFHDQNGKHIKKPDEIENVMDEPPSSIDKIILDRIQGSIVGMALGDALGAPVKSKPHQYLVANPIKDLHGGGSLNLKKGQFSSNTSMALCLVNSLIACHEFNPYDQLVRYKWWYKHGYMSVTGQCFDIDEDMRNSIVEFEYRQKVLAKQLKLEVGNMDFLSNPEVLRDFDIYCGFDDIAINGALGRLAPIPLFFFRHPQVAVEYAGISGRITHGDRKVYDACRYYSALIVAALHGYTKEQILDQNFYQKHKHWFGDQKLHPDIQEIAEGSYQKCGGYKDGIRGENDIVKALEAALWTFWSDDNSFEKGALTAVNLGDDTNTTCAIYGQLAGAYYGYKKLPDSWLEHVYARSFLEKLSKWIVYEGECWHKN